MVLVGAYGIATNGFDAVTINGGGGLHAEETAVFGLKDADANTVDVFYVQSFSPAAIMRVGTRGRSYPRLFAGGNALYPNNLAMAAATIYSLPHEIMHILLNADHRDGEPPTALFQGGTSTTKAPGGTKRIGPYPTAGPGAGDTIAIRSNSESLPLIASGVEEILPLNSTNVITYEALQPVIDETIGLWRTVASGLPAINKLEDVDFFIDDLPDGFLGQTTFSSITLDRDASGIGWFIDTTPFDHAEFDAAEIGGVFHASIDSEAFGRIDLLTVITHEFGHILGLEDVDSEQYPSEVMAGTLEVGVRKIPGIASVPQHLFNAPGASELSRSIAQIHSFNSVMGTAFVDASADRIDRRNIDNEPRPLVERARRRQRSQYLERPLLDIRSTRQAETIIASGRLERPNRRDLRDGIFGDFEGEYGTLLMQRDDELFSLLAEDRQHGAPRATRHS